MKSLRQLHVTSLTSKSIGRRPREEPTIFTLFVFQRYSCLEGYNGTVFAYGQVSSEFDNLRMTVSCSFCK